MHGVAVTMLRMLGIPTLLALVAQVVPSNAPITPAVAPTAAATTASPSVITAPQPEASPPADSPDLSATVTPTPAYPASSVTVQAVPGPNGVTFPQQPSPQFIQRSMADFQRTIDEQQLYRRTMLAALSSAHQQLLAQIVAELVIAPYPDVGAATRRLNAALTTAEAQNVMRIDQAKQTAMLQHFQRMLAESGLHAPMLQSQIPVPQPPSSSSVIRSDQAVIFTPPGNDAASVLLRTATMTLLTPAITGNVIGPSVPAH